VLAEATGQEEAATERLLRTGLQELIVAMSELAKVHLENLGGTYGQRTGQLKTETGGQSS
jgi:hypothetical protein